MATVNGMMDSYHGDNNAPNSNNSSGYFSSTQQQHHSSRGDSGESVSQEKRQKLKELVRPLFQESYFSAE
jgi:hypothetical protein